MRVPHLEATSFAIAGVAVLIAIAILVRERIRMRGSPQTVSADIVLVAVLLSLLPVLILFLVQVLLPMALPVALGMVWFIAFPVGVAWGILRGQLFDARGLARSSAAYGAATLAITGLFAFLITFADAAFARWNVNASSPWFSVVFLFFAILAFNPLREPPPDARGPALRPRPRRLPRGGAQHLRGDGVDALAVRDRRAARAAR